MIVKQNEGFVKKYFHEMGDFSRASIISVSSFRFLFPMLFYNPDNVRITKSTSLFSSS